MEQTTTKAYTLYPSQIDVIKDVAKRNGDSGDSAALRYIITDWQRRVERERQMLAAQRLDAVAARG